MYLVGQKRSDEVCIFLDVALDNSGSISMPCGGGKTRLAVRLSMLVQVVFGMPEPSCWNVTTLAPHAQVALECIQSIIRDPVLSLGEYDSFVLRTFNGYILERFCTHPHRFDYERMLSSIEHKPGDTQKTRLWDAMGKTINVMLDHDEKRRGSRRRRHPQQRQRRGHGRHPGQRRQEPDELERHRHRGRT